MGLSCPFLGRKGRQEYKTLFGPTYFRRLIGLPRRKDTGRMLHGKEPDPGVELWELSEDVRDRLEWQY
jgi:hypothetical protein